MRREDFLSQYWTPYPAAPAECRSLSRWKEGDSGWLGGILSWPTVAAAEGGEFLLLSADRSKALKWELPYLFAKSAEDTGQPLAQLPISHILQPGDQVAVQVEGGRIRKLMLLTPAMKERPVLNNTLTLRNWASFLSDVRAYFSTGGFLEINTPSLVTCPGLEPSLEPFKVGSNFLPTSPEIHLKKALALGFNDLFEIKLCFRDKENSRHHQPEFHMLEWYRSYADLSLIEKDLLGLLKAIGRNDPFTRNVHTVTFAGLFQKHFGFILTPETTRGELCGLAADLKISLSDNDSWNDIFHRIFVEKIEPGLVDCVPTILKDFPPSMAALARLTSAGWADRFEFYWKGLEIANAFHEVNDPIEQERRWATELSERKHLGTSEIPADPSLIDHLKMGMPPTGGIALGLERLFMALYNVKDIKSTRLFPA